MEKTREIAVFCVGRAVFFGSLAIGCIMLSFAFHPVMSFRAGAFLALIMAAILLWFALTAAKRPPKNTEVWIYLDDNSRPVNGHAERAFALIMREVYGVYARGALTAAIAFFLTSLALQLMGLQSAYR